ncbi:MAG: hypothetical protein JWM71_479 [Solirubrobacteraceae bacterium]|nr:hypothetical protein [Solirubrobacteraceae bacterium]
MQRVDTLSLLTVPLFTGAIGYLTNLSGVWMLFSPVEFAGVRIPGLAPLVRFLPRRAQQIPGVMQGGIGWQGIIPSRAAKMGSIAVDKGIAKLGSPAEFYAQLDPESIAEHVLQTARGDMRDVVERTLEREHPALWRDMPERMREAVHERVQEQLPDIVRGLMQEIGDNIDHLLDVKLMVIRRMESNPALANRIFQAVGRKELRFIVNFGFWFGLALGVPTALLTVVLLPGQWWLLPILGVFIGYVTNLLGILMIFEPVEPRRVFGVRWHGLFLRRQDEVSDVYAGIIADDVVTVATIGHELLHGPRADRTRHLIETAMRPAVDRATGPLQPAVRVAIGTREYDAIRESVAAEAVDYTITPLSDPDFNRRQGVAVRRLVSERMREMPAADFTEMLRTAIREDEWLLYLHGAVLGFGAGLIHLALFG